MAQRRVHLPLQGALWRTGALTYLLEFTACAASLSQQCGFAIVPFPAGWQDILIEGYMRGRHRAADVVRVASALGNTSRLGRLGGWLVGATSDLVVLAS